MRIDLPAFAGLNLAQNKSPRYVIGLIYTIASPHFTSHPGIINVPGVPIDNVLQNLSGTSQQLFPREGRSTISSFSFELADVAGAVTDELREQLTTNAEGLRGNDVRVFVGYTDDFNDFVRVQTPVVQDVTFDGTRYVIKCGDRTRQLRSKIFDNKKTNLDATLDAIQTTITVLSTTKFIQVQHTASFSDAPSTLIGYIQIKDSGEIISYTGKTATQFTGCLRERFGTQAKPVDFDATVIDDRKPEVIEFIYLEMPAPQMMLAVMTGDIDGTSPTDTLPAHWHLGLSPADIRTSDYLNIGNDLYDTTDVNKGLVVRFTHLEKVTGKAFIEKELHLLIGTFAPVYSDGTIGLKRINKIPKDAAFTTEIGDNEIVKISAVQHDQNDLANQFQVDWNYNGEDFTRRIFFTDSTSISIHGTSDVLAFEFKGLHGSRHTDPLIRQRINALRDRYAAPPLRLTVEVIPSLNQIEIGDVVRVNMPLLRDYTDTGPLLRSFEVQRAQVNWKTGAVSLNLFGSSALADSDPAISDAQALDDSYYDSQGVALSTVLTIVADAVTANGTVNGNDDMNNAGAIFYHLGNLTINAGVLVNITKNVQLRIRGFLTINGDIDGIGGGLVGTASPDTVGLPVVTAGREGLPGYVGNSRSGDGIIMADSPFTIAFSKHWPGVHTLGNHLAFPALNLEAVKNGSPLVADQLDGLPTDMQGTSGGAGAPLLDKTKDTNAIGGAGGASGAGLAIVCRGIGFGASGGIDLSGDDGLSVGVFASGGIDWQPGSGGAGGPGSLFVGLDGNAIGFPDLTKFTAETGLVPFPGTEATWRTSEFLGWVGAEPFAGLNDASQIISGAVLDNAALGIFYIPNPDQAAIDSIIGPIAPDSLVVTGISNALALAWDNVEQTDFLYIEVVRATTNDRSLGIIIASPQGDEYTDPSSGTFFYWIRKVDADGIKSNFFPLSATAGISGTSIAGVASSFHNGFEAGDEFDAWQKHASETGTLTAEITTVFSGVQSGAMDSDLADTDSPPPGSSGSTGSHFVVIPENLALLFAGQLVTVSVIARQALATPSISFAVAYSTNDTGNSGWQTFTPTAVFTKFSFDYQVPLPVLGGTDFLGIHPDLTGAGLDLIVDDVSVVIKGTGGQFIDTKFRRDPAQPATPTGDNPTGWTDTIPVGTDTVWQINGTKTAAGVLIGVWSTPATLQGLVFRGAYSSGTAYIINDVVTFSERSYICTQAGTGNDPTGTNAANAFWDLLAGKGDPGDPPTPFNETIVIGSQAGPVNLRALANAHTPPYDGIGDATVVYTLAPGVLVTGAAGQHGIDTGVWPSGSATIVLTVENEGTVRSGGGGGGKGGNNGNQNGSPGTNAGDAFNCQEDLTIDNAPSASGVIEAAGGGAGGGGGCTTSGGEPLNHGGGGGGGGFPNGAGGAGGGSAPRAGAPGAPGTTGGGGAGGGGSDGDGCIAGDGGSGGNVNVNGAAGANATGGQANASGGSGGARGFAVRKNGHTVTVTGGTVTGDVG